MGKNSKRSGDPTYRRSTRQNGFKYYRPMRLKGDLVQQADDTVYQMTPKGLVRVGKLVEATGQVI